MTRTTTAGLAMVGGLIVLLVAASAAFIELDGDGLLGAGIGAGLGLLNLAVGYLLTRRSLRRGMKSALRTLLGGFFARLLAVVGLTLAFQRTEAVDAVAFALTFLVFFFAYLGLEVLLVERTLTGRPA